MPKCKFAKQVKISLSGAKDTYCACKSQRAEVRNQYSGISRECGLPVMGSMSQSKKPGNWWTLCIGGKAFDTGVTPSRCDYY
jgi:hypothetical protein